jgi:2'-5' RNA ligase
MFVALVPPPEALESLAEFVEPRRQAEPGFRWTEPEQWHVTLAFYDDVPDRCLDDLLARLERAAHRRTCFTGAVAGGGAFPHPARAKVLYAGVDAEPDGVELSRLATGARAAGNKAGAPAAGGPFHPHITLARLRAPVEATRWVRILDSYRGPAWPARRITLIASHLGEGPRRRPRYEPVASFDLRSP